MKFISHDGQIINMKCVKKIEKDGSALRVYFEYYEPWHIHGTQIYVKRLFEELGYFLSSFYKENFDITENEILFDIDFITATKLGETR